MKIKFTASVLALFIMSTVSAGAQRYLCDGGIVLKGSIDGIYSGSTITLSVIDADETKSGLQENNNNSAIAYYGEFVAEEDNQYELAFSIKKSGAYRAYIGVASQNAPEEIEFEYINSNANTAAIADLMRPNADVAGIISANRNDLGLFTKAYDVADLTNAAEILEASLTQGETPECDAMIVLGEKSLLASAFNTNKVENVNEYNDVFSGDSIAAYLGKDIASSVTAMMSGKSIQTVEGFDNMLLESVLISLANNGSGAGMLEKALTEYSSRFGLPANKITSNLCRTMTARGGFNSMSDMVSYISNYSESTDSTLNSSPGGGGGGNNSFIGQTINNLGNVNTPREEYSVFTDLENAHWAKDAITHLYYKGIVNGKTDTEFCPNDYVKREEFAKLITSAFNINLVDEEFPFKDIVSEHWSYSYVKSAYLAGITSGITDDLFGLGVDIKRQDLCVMVYKMLEVCNISLENKKEAVVFTDESEISDYARGAVEALSCAGVISGDNLGCMNPQASATRAEAAVIIYGLIK